MTQPSTEVHRKHPLAECEKCPLFETGQFVPSDGPAKASLALVGEAPGRNEAQVGKPFIGDSGQLLNTVLRHFDIDRREVFLTNACLCRDRDGATPTSAALLACRPRLLEELRGREVQNVVAMGNPASQSILRTSTGVTSLRIGQGHYNSEELSDARIICTFHPAAALRVPDYFPSIVNDFGKLKGFFSSWYEPKWKAFDDEASALAALSELKRIPGSLVLDIESDIEKDVSFETPLRHKMLCIGIGYQPGKVVVIGETALESELVKASLLEYLTGRELEGQNMKFDLKGLWAYFGILLPLAFDTLLADYCLDERRGIHSLDYLAIEKLGSPNWKHALNKYKRPGEGYGVIPRDVLYKYNALDVHATAMLSELLKRMLDSQGLRPLHDFLCRASEQLAYVELNGIGLDKVYNAELAEGYGKTIAVLVDQIRQAIPDKDKWKAFNPNSPKQVKEVLKDEFGFVLPLKMNQKREYVETTDAETLETFLEANLGEPAEEFLRRMLAHRKEAKLYGTYVKGLRRRMWRGRVYPTFLLHGTNTGRLSCRNPNLQNIPRDSAMRRQFVPGRVGNVFVEGDFAQAEGRVLCWLAQDEFLREIFNDPTRDLFDELTPRLYGNVQGLNKAELKELRIRVKAYFYGLGYGREARSISLEYDIPLAEAERGMREFFKVIPATVKWREETRNQVLRGHDLTTPSGRHRRFWLITRTNRKDVLNEALAFKPQSISSDICLDAFVHIRPRLKGIGYVRNIVHDSILAECAPDKIDEVTIIMNEEMLAAAKRIVGDYVRFKVDFSSGPNWGALS